MRENWWNSLEIWQHSVCIFKFKLFYSLLFLTKLFLEFPPSNFQRHQSNSTINSLDCVLHRVTWCDFDLMWKLIWHRKFWDFAIAVDSMLARKEVNFAFVSFSFSFRHIHNNKLPKNIFKANVTEEKTSHTPPAFATLHSLSAFHSPIDYILSWNSTHSSLVVSK